MADRDMVDDILLAWRGELPEIAGLPLELSKRLTRLSDLFHRATEPVLTRHAVTKVEYGVLATLRAAGRPYRRKPRELSGSLVITTGGLSNVLLRLVDAGLVTREPDPEDGRSAWVTLTPSGVRTAESLVREVNCAHRALLSPLPPQTGKALADLLRETILSVDGAARSTARTDDGR
jgi:DNA-binding MarR family transcriptional regulator